MKENSREEDIEELKRLLYRNELSQYGKRKLINYYEQQEKDYKRVLKENEELKEYLITQNCEINRLNLDKIRLELSQVPDTTEQYKYLKNEYKMRLERTDLENYKLNYLSIRKVKDKIEELDEELEIMKVDNMYGRYKEYGGKSKWERLFLTKYGMHDALQELLEGRK